VVLAVADGLPCIDSALSGGLVASWHREVIDALEDSTLRVVAAEARCAASIA